MKLSKTIYLSYRDCAHNAWVRVHRPQIYGGFPLSDFEQALIETGRDVDALARELFPGGTLIEREDYAKSAEHIRRRAPVLYQAVFETPEYTTACDILRWNPSSKSYDLYEVKSSTSNAIKDRDELYTYDLAFQAEVLRICDVPLGRLFLVRLSSTYERGESLDLEQLFAIEDFSDGVEEVRETLPHEMAAAFDLLRSNTQPAPPCACMYKGRSAHCTTFSYLNPGVADYSVHDIARIGLSRVKLAALIDRGIVSILDVPEEFELTTIQRNQVRAAQSRAVYADPLAIAAFLKRAAFPISFLDYETYPCAVPRFRGYRPFDQIPFQFSLHILGEPNAPLEHHEFLHTSAECPDGGFIAALDRLLPAEGSVAVWSEQFEKGINDALAARNPDAEGFLRSINKRVIDLIDIFADQAYVHPAFKGRTSIKWVLPALVPALTYDSLAIQDGAAACEAWNRLVTGRMDAVLREKSVSDLLVYCGQDTRAMFEIWNVLWATAAAHR
jgi:hypothetical protein